MKSLLICAALVAAAISPSVACAAPTKADSVARQAVFTSVSHTIIENGDGTETVITVYTSYYVFGVR
jgi:hypothetical protein